VTQTVEIVRWSAPPETAEALVSGHSPARRAIDAVAPGWIWSRLARYDERTWIEIVVWLSRRHFLRALELSVEQPVARNWFELADDGWTLELGERLDGDEGVPPLQGTLEVTSAHGEDGDLVAAPDPRTSWSSLIELDGRVWSEGEWRVNQPSLLRLEVRDAAAAPPCPPWTRAARIEHSCDAVERMSRSA
jgi:hypothetical protein